MTETTQAPAPAGARRGPRWGIIAAVTGAVLAAVAVIALLAVTLAGQSSQIGALRTQVRIAATAAATAQHKADDASSSAAAVGKTQAAATNANLGVCVDVTYGSGSTSYVQSMSVTSPVKAPGGAVSCYSGTFVPVAPQKGTPAAD